MPANRFEVYEYMQPLDKDMITGEFVIKKITLASETDSPLSHQRHTLWANIPGGYWEYKNPWTKKALNMIVAIQNEYDEGKRVSYIPNWHRCSECNKWVDRCSKMCYECEYD